MPIVNNLSGNEIEILKLADFLTGVGHDITDVYFGELQIFTVWTETEGALPLTINANGEALIDYKIYGNMEQTGTPTPENPIVPSECGERTENLFDISMVEQGGYNAMSGTTPSKTVTSTRCRYSEIIPLLAPTLSLYCSPNVKINYVWVDANGKSLGGSGFQKSGDTATAPEQAVSMTFILGLDDDVNCTPSDFYNVNLVAGSTPQPFGYKLPLLSGSTPVDIYIGNEPLRKIGDYADYIDYGTGKIVRQVGKVVLTGTETINGIADTPYDTKAISYYYSNLGMTDIIGYDKSMTLYPYPSYGSTHFVTKSHGRNSWTDINDGEIGANGYTVNTRNRYLIFGTSYQTEEEFKQFLANQYANGTPVTIWYVLATPIEEDPPVPFPRIPTFDGSTTIIYDGTPAPEMYVKYRKNGT